MRDLIVSTILLVSGLCLGHFYHRLCHKIPRVNGKIHTNSLYLFSVVMTPFCFIYQYFKTGISSEFFIGCILFSLLILFTVCDLSSMIVPNHLIIIGFVSGLLFRLFFPGEGSFLNYIIGSVLGFLILFLLVMISRGGLGMGDVKLFAVIGLFIGWKSVLAAILLTSVFGFLHALIMLIRGKRKHIIPYVPSISFAAWCSYYWGGLL